MKNNINLKNILLAFFSLVFFVGLLLCGSRLYICRCEQNMYTSLSEAFSVSSTPTDARAEKTSAERLVSMDFTELKKINPDITGWIKIEGADVDYPVLRGADNEYYLHRLYDGSEGRSGSIFEDCRNAENFTGDNTVIYGHLMNNRSMFNGIADYKKQSFYDKYPTGLLYTPDGDFLIEFICGTVEDGNFEFVEFSFDCEQAFDNYILPKISASTFVSSVTPEYGDKLISLICCSYEHNNARYMLTGRLVPLYG